MSVHIFIVIYISVDPAKPRGMMVSSMTQAGHGRCCPCSAPEYGVPELRRFLTGGPFVALEANVHVVSRVSIYRLHVAMPDLQDYLLPSSL